MRGPDPDAADLPAPATALWKNRDYMAKPAKNTICLWYDRDAEEAARFYAKTFPDSSVGAVHRAPGDFPSGKQGDVLTVEFTVMRSTPCSASVQPAPHSRHPGVELVHHAFDRLQEVANPPRIHGRMSVDGLHEDPMRHSDFTHDVDNVFYPGGTLSR